MLAHDFVQRDRKTDRSSRAVLYSGLIICVKILKCLGVFLSSELLKMVNVFQLSFLLKFGASLVLTGIQRPFSGRSLRRDQWTKIVHLAALSAVIQVLWFYGITLCGPVRSVLLFENSGMVVSAAICTLVSRGGKSPSQVRGTVLLLLGVTSLILLDRDVTVDHHDGFHQHRGTLDGFFYHFINWFGVADHKSGVAVLLLALLLQTGFENAFKKLAVEIEGSKRLYAATTILSCCLLFPFALVTFVSAAPPAVESVTQFWLMVVLAVFFLFVLDFYGQAISLQHLESAWLGRWLPIVSFLSSFVLGHLWFPAYRSASITDIFHRHGLLASVEHGLSGGVIFALVLLSLGNYVLTSPHRPRARTGEFVGWSTSGLPLYVHGEDFLQKTSQSIAAFAKTTLKQILASSDSRRIFYFLCLNLSFCGVEFAYGILTNSLGLISDGFHMLFDCTALVMGLVASVMSRWKGTRHFSYGYGRVEVLSGFINALFLVVIAFFIFLEALERLYDPPHVHTEKLLVVSVAGLAVNLFGILAFQGHGHSHGGGGEDHGHSHGDHGHSHGGGNANMQGVFLHVLADTLGSVFVIISSLLIQYFGWHWVDPLCSLILSVLILLSVLPLLQGATATIVQRIPPEMEHDFHAVLDKILLVEGVLSYSRPHLWQLKSESYVGSVHVQVSNEVNPQRVAQLVLNEFRAIGIRQTSVQVEKDSFFHQITALCPGYEYPHRVSRNPLQQSLLVKAI